jgi:hypothetical protein
VRKIEEEGKRDKRTDRLEHLKFLENTFQTVPEVTAFLRVYKYLV